MLSAFESLDSGAASEGGSRNRDGHRREDRAGSNAGADERRVALDINTQAAPPAACSVVGDVARLVPPGLSHGRTLLRRCASSRSGSPRSLRKLWTSEDSRERSVEEPTLRRVVLMYQFPRAGQGRDEY
ncbi:hypothetical protein HETIRDRAFT_453050 [Heterobasidion irregulare TC 32-1]|uniref:Uncharacterized protein n=1 Tax=Heterobasidion irregulare (strain TC 32-1) TaxID=747525 RepID=W4K2K3_HETIT|nr:uncharacterized protein HETIRDRAFT_453050 [Heterobasidion irregulare TC 32-1]ETW80058.1 hypothetical protein HETIRDRAFT_453050 [Heterobasidion irregulare TC 32-1]